MTEPATPNIVTREEWEQARAELLVREKAHTHAGDELAAARRRLPMTRMEPVMVVGRSGPVPLADVFEGRGMLIVYHFGCDLGAALDTVGFGRRPKAQPARLPSQDVLI